MNPYQPGEDNQDHYEVGYKAGAASRDAEVAKAFEDGRQAEREECAKVCVAKQLFGREGYFCADDIRALMVP